GAGNGIAELAGDSHGQALAAVDREREHVGGLIDSEVVALQHPDLLGADEDEAELPLLDALGGQHRAGKRGRSFLVHLDTAAIRYFDRDHASYLLRSVPVSSACSRYASTMRWTSLCRTTSSWPKRTKATPSSEPRMSWTWISPDAWSRGKSTWVTSPVTTTFEPKPRRVRDIS